MALPFVEPDYEPGCFYLLNVAKVHGFLNCSDEPRYNGFFTLDNRIKEHDSRSIFFNQLDEIIHKNKEDYNWKWHDGGIPVLRTRYVELVHKERNTFIPLAFLVVTVVSLSV